MSTTADQTYRRFLLGIASEEEESRAEEAILAGEVDASFLHDVEDELIDDYVLGNITQEERPGFAAHFLAVDERRGRVAFAAALVECAQKQTTKRPAVDQELAASGGILSALFWRRFALLASAASVLLAALVGFQQVKLRQQLQIAGATQNELSRLRGAISTGNSKSSSPDALYFSESPTSPQSGLNPMPTIHFWATREVKPFLFRNPARTPFVAVNLDLSSLPLAGRYHAVVRESNLEPIWTSPEFSASIVTPDQLSTIIMPTSSLSPGRSYHFQVESASGKIQFKDYVFMVANE